MVTTSHFQSPLFALSVAGFSHLQSPDFAPLVTGLSRITLLLCVYSAYQQPVTVLTKNLTYLTLTEDFLKNLKGKDFDRYWLPMSTFFKNTSERSQKKGDHCEPFFVASPLPCSIFLFFLKLLQQAIRYRIFSSVASSTMPITDLIRSHSKRRIWLSCANEQDPKSITAQVSKCAPAQIGPQSHSQSLIKTTRLRQAKSVSIIRNQRCEDEFPAVPLPRSTTVSLAGSSPVCLRNEAKEQMPHCANEQKTIEA